MKSNNSPLVAGDQFLGRGRKWLIFITVLIFTALLYMIDKDTKGIADIWTARFIPAVMLYFLPTYLMCTVVLRDSGASPLIRFAGKLIVTILLTFASIILILLALKFIGVFERW